MASVNRRKRFRRPAHDHERRFVLAMLGRMRLRSPRGGETNTLADQHRFRNGLLFVPAAALAHEFQDAIIAECVAQR